MEQQVAEEMAYDYNKCNGINITIIDNGIGITSDDGNANGDGKVEAVPELQTALAMVQQVASMGPLLQVLKIVLVLQEAAARRYDWERHRYHHYQAW